MAYVLHCCGDTLPVVWLCFVKKKKLFLLYKMCDPLLLGHVNRCFFSMHLLDGRLHYAVM